jgi:ABC-type glycerol-3-phosphate transport system permease component
MKRGKDIKMWHPWKIIKLITITFIAFWSILPIYNTVIVSLTPFSNMLEPMLFPKYFNFQNFVNAFNIIDAQMVNSFLYSIITVIIAMLISIPASYTIARIEFIGKKVVLFALLFSQMLAGIVLMPSVYSIFNKLRLSNTVFGLILVYVGVNLALTIWLLIGFFSSIPKDIEEAAIIDGTGRLQLLVHVVVPMLKPGIAVSAIFVFINTYNEFVIPLFLVTDAKLYTITLTLNSLMTATTIEWHHLAASSLIGMVPPIVIFLFFQRNIVEGVVTGAIKG